MPPLNTARQSHHRNESAGEAAFHRSALRETGTLDRIPSCKERQPTKPAIPTSNNVRKDHNADARPHKSMQDNARKPTGCLSCFLLPGKRPKDVSGACSYGVVSKPIREHLNTTKAGPIHISKTHTVTSPRHKIVTHKRLVNIGEKPHFTKIESHSNKKSSGTSMIKPRSHAVASHTRDKASESGLNRPQGAPIVSKTSSKPSPLNLMKPQAALSTGKTSGKSMSLIRPHLVVKAANKSSPPMNISSPQSADTLGQLTRRSSPISISSECLGPLPKQSKHTLHLHKGPRPPRVAEQAKLSDTAIIREKVTDSDDAAHAEKKVVWREGLLQRLGRLHGLGNCKLSLEELIELDDNACLDELESLQQRECGLLHQQTQRASSSATRPSIASTWNMEFEGGRPILPLQRQDVSPEIMRGIVWPVSHTNCLFESSKRHPPSYKEEECR